MTLSKTEIQNYCNKKELVRPYDEKQVQTCSYDLTFSGEYYYYRKKDGNRVNVCQLNEYEKLYIPADAICYVLSSETVKMSMNLTASISLAFGLIKKGVMLAAQPPYDPGYEGKTVALLHNLSDEEVEISKGDHILNIVFNELSSPVKRKDLYCGKYQGLNSLNKYCTKVKKGAVFVLKQELEEQKKKINNLLPMLLTLITVILGVLTILFSFFSISDRYEAGKQESDIDGHQEPLFFVDESGNSLLVVIDGKQYKVKLEDDSIQK